MGASCSCCGRKAPRSGDQPHHKGSRRRAHPRGWQRRHRGPRSSSSDREGSVISESDWHDARDAFSVTDEVPSPDDLELPPHVEGEDGVMHGFAHSDAGSEMFPQHESSGLFSSCLSIMRDSRPPSTEPHHSSRPISPHPKSTVGRPLAGSSFPRAAAATPREERHNCWDEADATCFSIRSLDYMRTKVKVHSDKAIYRLVALDLYSTETKAMHVAKHVQLPPCGPPVMVRSGVPGCADVALPPLIVMNLQLPGYPAGFFGPNDGPGQSFVFYFALPEDFDPARFENKAALGLLSRFVSNGREADGTMARDRLKIIARVINVDEWAQKGPLSAPELRLLQNYNEKPVMSRPQHFFYVGPNHLEVDLDIHSYAFLARKALNSYATRLKDVVWEIGFVLQGNAADELPEQVLGCACIFRAEFSDGRPFTPLTSVLNVTAHQSGTNSNEAQAAAAAANTAAAAAAGDHGAPSSVPAALPASAQGTLI